jgi:hypothetical protein
MADQLDKVFQLFVHSLSKPFQIHDRISVHLDNPILANFVQRYEHQDDNTRAGLLCSILPRKRMNDLIKSNASELIQLASVDKNGYIRTLALMAKDVPTTSTINVSVLDSVPEINEFLLKCSTCIDS